MAGALALPPSGRGVYARDQGVDWLARFSWVALNASRSDAPAKARELIARGVRVWFYSTPERWRPHVWPAEVVRLRDLVRATGAQGFIADPETGWPELSSAERAAEARALGAALRGAGVRVGVTSYPLWPARRELAAALDGAAWASPQLYRDRGASTLAAWFRDWQALFGADRVIPGVALWANDDFRGADAADRYRAYLESMPRAVGSVAWTTSSTPAHMLTAYLETSPAGSAVGRVALEARAILTSKAGLVALALITIAALAFLVI